MNEVQKAINEAFGYLATIPVSGDSVEVMAVAKDALRRAYALADDKPKADEKKKDDG